MNSWRALPIALLLVVTGCSAIVSSPSSLPTYEGIAVLSVFPTLPDSAGATPWQESVEPPPGMGADDTTYDGPGRLLTDLARQQGGSGGQVRVAFLGMPGPDAARGVVQLWGAPDDSILGVEFDLDLKKGPRGWYVAVARDRTHCRRGVTADGFSCV
jgi:hypothetical protein